jgi:excisionase family DNA binding protein
LNQSNLSCRTFGRDSTPVAPIVATRLLYDRKEAARQLSISVRSLDYLIAAKELDTRRIGKKILIPHAELVRFAKGNHPEPMKRAA